MKAHYAGDNTYAPSDSAPVAVTVAPEPSTTLISIPVFDPSTGRERATLQLRWFTVRHISSAWTSAIRGDADISAAAGLRPADMSNRKRGTFDSVSGGASGIFALNSVGYAEYLSIQLTGGTHQLTASYSGDDSYGPSTGTYSLMVTPATTQISALDLIGLNTTGSPG